MSDPIDDATPVPPTLNSVECQAGEPSPRFSATWSPNDGYNGPFTIVVTDSGGTEIPGTSNAGSNMGTWTSDADAMEATGNYYLAIKPTGSALSSSKIWLRFTAPTEVATQFDGTVIDIEWTPPVGPPSGEMFISFRAGSYSQSAIATGTTGTKFAPDLTQVPTGEDWTIALTPQQGNAAGLTSTAAQVFWQQPPVTGLSLSAGTGAALDVTTETPADGVPAGSSFMLQVTSDAYDVFTSSPIAGVASGSDLTVTATIPEPIAPLDLGRLYDAAMCFGALVPLAAGGNRVSRGPTGLSMTLLPAPPASVSVSTYVPSGAAANRDVTVTIAPPNGPVSPTGSSVHSSLTATSPVSGPSFTQTIPLVAPTIGSDITVAAQAMVGNSLALTSANVPVITSLPSLTQVNIDDDLLSLTWDAVADAGTSGYEIVLLSNGDPVARYETAGTSTVIPRPSGPFEVSINAAGTATKGPASTPAPALTQAPRGLQAAWTATSTDGTLTWSAVDGGDHYEVELWQGDEAVKTLTTDDYTASLTLPGTGLAPGMVYRFTVRAVVQDGTIKKQGPRSQPAPILTQAPSAVETTYDGAVVQASWQADPQATGYSVSVMLAGAVQGVPVQVGEPRASIPLAWDASSAYKVVVQSTKGLNKGPASAGQGVFDPGFYLNTPAGEAPQISPFSTVAMAPEVVSLYLPDIFTTAPDPTALPVNDTFTMTAATAPYAYALTIPVASKAWTFTADPIRADVKADYLALILALDGLTATPAGIATVQQAVGRMMPQTYAETLYYNYGFVGDEGYCDLRPGTVLRAEYEGYQYVGANERDAGYLNGYVTSAVAEYAITTYLGGGAELSGLDSFIGQIAAAGGVSVPTPNSDSGGAMQGGGGVIDSFYPQFRRPFLRLLYPSTFQSQNSQGTAYPQSNALLLAGSSFSVLNAATKNIRDTGLPGADVALLYFRGRTSLSASIDVWLNGSQRRVPIATTLAGLLETTAARPAAMDLPVSNVGMNRASGVAVTQEAATLALGSGNPVQLGWVPDASAARLALPLLHGDRVDVQGP